MQQDRQDIDRHKQHKTVTQLRTKFQNHHHKSVYCCTSWASSFSLCTSVRSTFYDEIKDIWRVITQQTPKPYLNTWHYRHCVTESTHKYWTLSIHWDVPMHKSESTQSMPKLLMLRRQITTEMDDKWNMELIITHLSVTTPLTMVQPGPSFWRPVNGIAIALIIRHVLQRRCTLYQYSNACSKLTVKQQQFTYNRQHNIYWLAKQMQINELMTGNEMSANKRDCSCCGPEWCQVSETKTSFDLNNKGKCSNNILHSQLYYHYLVIHSN